MNSRVRNSVWAGYSSVSLPGSPSNPSPLLSPDAFPAGFSDAWTPRFREEFAELSREPNREVLQESLLAFGRRLEAAGHSRPALEIYASFSRLGSVPETVRQRASAAYLALTGQGPWQHRAEILGQNFTGQVTNPAFLGGLVVAGGVFQATRLAVMNRVASGAGFWSRGLAAEALSWGTGFAAEVPALTLGTRGIHALLGHSQDWSSQALQRELSGNAVTLFALKGAGALGQSAVNRLRTANGLSSGLVRTAERLLPSAATLTGLLGARSLERQFGMRPASDPGNGFLDSLATLLQFHVAGRLTAGLGAASWEFQYRRIPEWTVRPRPSRIFPAGANEAFAPFAMAVPVSPGRNARDHILAMSMENGSNGAASPPLPLPKGATLDAITSALSRVQEDIGSPISLEINGYLWAHPAYRQAIEIFTLIDRFDAHWVEAYRTPEFETALNDARGELRNLIAFLESARYANPTLSDQPAYRSILSKFYKSANAALGFLVSGSITGLKEVTRLSFAVRGELGEILGPQSGQAGEAPDWLRRRPWLDPLSPEIRGAVPYDFLFNAREGRDWLEVPGNDQKIFLLGRVPDVRAVLSRHHSVEIQASDVDTGYEFMGWASLNGNPGRIRPVRRGTPLSQGDYLEAYDAVALQDLEGENAPHFLRSQILHRLRPGGIGFLVSRDARVQERLIEVLARNQLADILSAAQASPLPVATNRSDADSSQYIFIQRLRDPE